MSDNLVQKIFKNEVAEFLAVQMSIVLDTQIRRRIRLEKREWFDQDLVAEVFERKCAPLIRGILGYISPELSMNIYWMDERIIWRVYWCLRSNLANKKISFLEFLAKLDKNPPFASIFA